MNDNRLVTPRFPYVPLAVTIGTRIESVEALLDTGFSGDLVLPAEMSVGTASARLRLKWVLADGSETTAPAALGQVQLGEFSPFAAIVAFMGKEALLGRGISDRFRKLMTAALASDYAACSRDFVRR